MPIFSIHTDMPIVSMDHVNHLFDIVGEPRESKSILFDLFEIQEETLDREDAKISLRQLLFLVRHYSTLRNFPELGYEFGFRLRLTLPALLGLVANADGSSDIPGHVIMLSSIEENGKGIIRVDGAQSIGNLKTVLSEIFTGFLSASAPVIFGTMSALVEIHVDHPRPDHHTNWEKSLLPVKFEMPSMELHFPSEIRNKSIYISDIAPLALHLNAVGAPITPRRDDSVTLSQRVKFILNGATEKFPSLVDIAQHLHVSTSTLKRHLFCDGTSYQRLLDEEKFQRASYYLRETRYSVEEIARRLHYSDSSNFIRSFRRWAGVSPSVWRNRKSEHEADFEQPAVES